MGFGSFWYVFLCHFPLAADLFFPDIVFGPVLNPP